MDFGLPASRAPRCGCCGMLLDPRDQHCYLCDAPDDTHVSPPHLCVKSGRVLTDGRPVRNIRFPRLAGDHEVDKHTILAVLELRKNGGVPPCES